MARYLTDRGRGVLTLGVAAAALAAACSSSTSLHRAAPCPSYSGGSAKPDTLAGTYSLVTFCQDTLPALGTGQGYSGSLILTKGATPDTFKATITPPSPASPVNITGPYTVSHDTITVTLAMFGNIPFPVTYAFSANTLYVSGSLPGGVPQPLAIVFFR
jgi:hypothetical protein